MVEGEEGVRDAMGRLGITFDLFRQVGVSVLGSDGYKTWSLERRRKSCSKVGLGQAERYRALSPEEKMIVLQKRFPRVRSKLEIRMFEDLVSLGESNFELNRWQALVVFGKVSPREADVKLSVDGKRKLVIVCDGEAFHGPKCIFGDPDQRILDDQETARAYFDAGYSVIRYSETEITSGVSRSHLRASLERLRADMSLRVMRTWYPPIEVWR